MLLTEHCRRGGQGGRKGHEKEKSETEPMSAGKKSRKRKQIMSDKWILIEF